MKPMAAIVVGWILAFSIILPTPAQAYSAISVHEIEQEVAPKAVLEIQKDPTGGFNVHVVTTNFVWRPEMASMYGAQRWHQCSMFPEKATLMFI